ncbi:TetR/AcrR family transcriptional regulator [Yimella sp. cx-51]|uniref:TetR/AcrR family transcriptional regulator n=1 Tax=Yimella sp. cx-51 TaxID=2770551 RepID=UPI00165E3761|nr:TetR/AcrR family transcriptional regulator [Yimella sp. cx-51]MBC9955823.1 TetR/AcrR family transcriptional regulator [Yimella sp. cx-51]QTH37625.1 TetR/AcrR family transcriptional regulator [Yimella sp. cx-51]
MAESVDEALWRAVREEVGAYGVSRSTVTSVAQRAGLSRMTVYRRAGGMEQLVLDALAHELGSVVPLTALDLESADDPVAEVATAVAEVVGELMDSALLQALRRHDPHLLMPYVVGHFGRGQVSLTEQLVELITRARRRCRALGRPLRSRPSAAVQARFLILSLQTFVIGVDPDEPLDRRMITGEVTHLVAGYLASGRSK